MARMNWQRARRPYGGRTLDYGMQERAERIQTVRAKPPRAGKHQSESGRQPRGPRLPFRCHSCHQSGVRISITTGPLTEWGLSIRHFCGPQCAAAGGFAWAR